MLWLPIKLIIKLTRLGPTVLCYICIGHVLLTTVPVTLANYIWSLFKSSRTLYCYHNKITCAIFLDLAKAFDTVDYVVLLQKLLTYGIRGIALDLFESYLNNRKHCTVVHGVSSGVENVTCGVPQGSTLGPLLFLLYMNDLPLNTNSKVNLFADDTNLIMSGSDAKQ